MKKLFSAYIVWFVLIACVSSTSEAQGVKGPALPRRPQNPKLPFKHAKGLKRDPVKIKALRAAALKRHGVRALPKVTVSSWDSRTLGVIPPIRDQGQCGSCWDFSGSSMVTVALIVAGTIPNGANQISEQYTLDCGKNGGCDGDDNTTVLAYAKATGLPLDSDYGPYTASAGRCKAVDPGKLLKLTDFGFVTPGANNYDVVSATQDIKNAIATYKMVGCAVAADDAFSNYNGGIFTGSGSTQIDHDVAIIGWQDYDATHPAPAGSKATGYWIMRNSWNTSWGESGYMRIEYGANLLGTESVWAMVAPAPGPTPVPPTPPPGPTPVPPGPTPPTPTPSTVMITLTTDQVVSVLQQSNAVAISRDTSIGAFLDAIERCKQPMKKACDACTTKVPAKEASPTQAEQWAEQKRFNEAILAALQDLGRRLPAKKE